MESRGPGRHSAGRAQHRAGQTAEATLGRQAAVAVHPGAADFVVVEGRNWSEWGEVRLLPAP